MKTTHTAFRDGHTDDEGDEGDEAYDEGGEVDGILPDVLLRLIIEMLPAKQWMQLLFVNKEFNLITSPLSTKCSELWNLCRYVFSFTI
jgi:hypothetical protein